MTTHEKAFLLLLRDAVGADHSSDIPLLSAEEWRSVFILATQHHVLPLVIDEVYRKGVSVPSPGFQLFQKRAMRIVSIQTAKTSAFLKLYKHLSSHGLEPIVLKGIACRELYLNPDFRFSADEDLLIRPEEALVYHKVLTGYGLKTDHSQDEVSSSHETGMFLKTDCFIWRSTGHSFRKTLPHTANTMNSSRMHMRMRQQ